VQALLELTSLTLRTCLALPGGAAGGPAKSLSHPADVALRATLAESTSPGGMSALAGGEELALKAVLGNELGEKTVRMKGRDLIVTFPFRYLGGRRTSRR
jgi:hypothetical protein